jgi:hypothetical protein
MRTKLFLAFVLCGSLAFSQSARKTVPKKHVKKNMPASAGKPAASPSQSNGVMVFIDPETHQIRPGTPEEIRALGAPAASTLKTAAPAPGGTAEVAEPKITIRPDGSTSVRLDESSMSYSVATKKPDGSLTYQCVTGSEQAKAAVSDKKSAASTKGGTDVQ